MYIEMPLYRKHIYFSKNSNKIKKLKIIKWDKKAQLRTHIWYDDNGNIKTIVKNVV